MTIPTKPVIRPKIAIRPGLAPPGRRASIKTSQIGMEPMIRAVAPEGTRCSAQETRPLPPKEQQDPNDARSLHWRAGAWVTGDAPPGEQDRPRSKEPHPCGEERRNRLDDKVDRQVGRSPDEIQGDERCQVLVLIHNLSRSTIKVDSLSVQCARIDYLSAAGNGNRNSLSCVKQKDMPGHVLKRPDVRRAALPEEADRFLPTAPPCPGRYRSVFGGGSRNASLRFFRKGERSPWQTPEASADRSDFLPPDRGRRLARPSQDGTSTS